MYMYIVCVYIFIYTHIAGNVPQCSICRWVVSGVFFQFSHISHASDPNHHQIQSLFALGQPTGWLANHHR